MYVVQEANGACSIYSEKPDDKNLQCLECSEAIPDGAGPIFYVDGKLIRGRPSDQKEKTNASLEMLIAREVENI